MKRRQFAPPTKFPPTGVVDVDIINAHTHSSNHRPELFQSEHCGCFGCLATFPAEAIEEFAAESIEGWTDTIDGVGVTALCPECGLDTVLGSACGFPIEDWFLQRMREHWLRIAQE